MNTKHTATRLREHRFHSQLTTANRQHSQTTHERWQKRFYNMIYLRNREVNNCASLLTTIFQNLNFTWKATMSRKSYVVLQEEQPYRQRFMMHLKHRNGRYSIHTGVLKNVLSPAHQRFMFYFNSWRILQNISGKMVSNAQERQTSYKIQCMMIFFHDDFKPFVFF